MSLNLPGRRPWWRRVDVWSVLVAISSLLTLIFVVAVRNAGELATLALALAVLAFIVQIIVLVVDLQDGHRRDLDAQSVNADTRALLSRIEGQTTNTERMLHDQLSKLIDSSIIRSKPNLGESNTPEMQQRIDALNDLRSEVAPTGGQDREAHAMLVTSWPSEAAVAQLMGSGLDRLTPLAYPLLDILAMDVVSAYESGGPEGRLLDMPQYAEAARELIANGYVRREGAAIVLTPLGMQAGSLVNKQGDLPPYITNMWPALPEVRLSSQH